MSFNPTENQEKVLNTEGVNQIVSASAGSGKTTVMVELIIKRIMQKKLDLDKVLLITFTNSATNDMKLKLASKLQDAIKQNPSTYLKKQFDKISTCKISTIDKFCQDIVKQYFYVVDISPNFNVLTKEDMKLIRDKAFDKVMKKHIEDNNTDVLNLALMLLQRRSQDALKELVYNAYDFMRVQGDEKEFAKNAMGLFTLPIEDNKVFKYYECEFEKTTKSLCDRLTKIKDSLFGANRDIDAFIDEVVTKAGSYRSVLEIDSVCLGFSVPNFKDFKEEKAKIKSAVDDYKEDVKSYAEDLGILGYNNYNMEDVIKSVGGMVETLISFTFEFEKEYINLKRENNSYEFNDIEHFAMQILENEDIVDAVSQGIDQIFVDEYQDVNELQDAIVSKVARKDNLFMVGDMKQSIYGFRLCAPYIFINKFYLYLNGGGGQAHILNENFRSNPKILGFVNDIFNIAMTRDNGGIDYVNDGAFNITSSESNEVLCPINIHLIDKNKEENVSLASVYSVRDAHRDKSKQAFEQEGDEILSIIYNLLGSEIYDKETKSLRKTRYKDIAILFRNRGKLYNYLLTKLSRLGVPTSIDFKVNIFDSFIARFLNSVLKLVLCVNDDISLATVMKFDGFGFNEEELLEIRKASNSEFFYEAVLNYNGDLRPRINAMLAFISELKNKSIYSKVTDLLEEISKKVDIKKVLLSKPFGMNLLASYERFMSYVGGLKYNDNLVDYLLYVQKLNEDKSADVTLGGGDAVTMMTIHSSKGLEFPIVILADAGEQFRNTIKRSPIVYHREGVGTYFYDLGNNFKMPTPMYNYLARLKRIDEVNEELRLLYVALTRPKNILYITACVNMETIGEKRSKNNYIGYILNGVDDLKFNTFMTQGLYQDKDMRIVMGVGKEVAEVEKTTQKVNFAVLKALDERIAFKYTHPSNISYKLSVTELSSQESPHTYTSQVNKLVVSEDEMELSGLGTLYHKVLELVDYMNVKSVDDLADKIKSLPLDKNQIDMIDVNSVYSIKKCLSVFGDGLSLEKEKRFLFKAPYSEFVGSSNVSDEVLVQGVVDLIVTDKNGDKYIVDYKLTYIDDETTLKNRYYKQLEIYSKSLMTATGEVVKGAYLYLIRQCKLVKLF